MYTKLTQEVIAHCKTFPEQVFFEIQGVRFYVTTKEYYDTYNKYQFSGYASFMALTPEEWLQVLKTEPHLNRWPEGWAKRGSSTLDYFDTYYGGGHLSLSQNTSSRKHHIIYKILGCIPVFGVRDLSRPARVTRIAGIGDILFDPAV